MGFWSRILGDHRGITANPANPTTGSVSEPSWEPGDPDGVEILGEETFSRSLSPISASPWSGWPADWNTPTFGGGLQALVDTAWAAIDLNASVLAAMPAYRLRNGQVIPPLTWMRNPDPRIYSSWFEFAKQLFWDYQLGEAFVLPTDFYENGFPATFRVIPPWFVNVEMGDGNRRYSIGGADVTDDILHIRYHSTTTHPRGHGPLEASGARMVAAGVLARYVAELVESGGVPQYWIEIEKRLSQTEADDLLEQWVASRKKGLGRPAIMSGGAQLKHPQFMSAKDLTLMELAQFTESRIAIMLGVPPFLLGLPGGGDSLTYTSTSMLFDFHHRSSLNPKATAVMQALTNWAVPRGQSVELNRDEYTRPPLADRAAAYEKLVAITALTPEEVRQMERFVGDTSNAQAAASLTGIEDQVDPRETEREPMHVYRSWGGVGHVIDD